MEEVFFDFISLFAEHESVLERSTSDYVLLAFKCFLQEYRRYDCADDYHDDYRA